MGASAGRVLLIPKGDWNANTTYTGLDWVRHNGAAWVCKNTCTNIEPTLENADNWQMMARDGSQIIVDAEISDQSENPVQNKVIKKYVDDKQVEVPIAGIGKAGIVKPADGLTVAEDGTLKVKLDGTTLTMDQVNNVIKLADTLKNAINGALPSANVVNNQTTTAEGFALDARQANPNIDGTLAKQVGDLNGSLNFIAPKGETALRSSDGIVSLSVYNDSLYIKYDKDKSKDYYAELTVSTSGMVLIKNDSSGYHRKQIVNLEKLNDFTDISSKDDLNDIKFFNVGKYRCSSNVVAATVLNSPFNTAFTMEAFQSAGTPQYIAQKAIEFESGHCKWRMRDTLNGTMAQDWVQLY